MANITGKYNLANFGIYPYCKAEFHLSAVDTDTNAAYIPDAVSVVIGSDGSIDAELWENDNGSRGTVYTNHVVVYADSSYQREVKRIGMGKIVVIGDAEIQDLLVTNVVPSTQENALALAQAAAASAAVDAAAADVARDEAEAARDQAQTAAALSQSYAVGQRPHITPLPRLAGLLADVQDGSVRQLRVIPWLDSIAGEPWYALGSYLQSRIRSSALRSVPGTSDPYGDYTPHPASLYPSSTAVAVSGRFDLWHTGDLSEYGAGDHTFLHNGGYVHRTQIRAALLRQAGGGTAQWKINGVLVGSPVDTSAGPHGSVVFLDEPENAGQVSTSTVLTVTGAAVRAVYVWWLNTAVAEIEYHRLLGKGGLGLEQFADNPQAMSNLQAVVAEIDPHLHTWNAREAAASFSEGGRLSKFFDVLDAANSRPDVIVCSELPCTTDDTAGALVPTRNALLLAEVRRRQAAGKSYAYVDLYSQFGETWEAARDFMNGLGPEYKGDGIHSTWRGAATFYKPVVDMVDNIARGRGGSDLAPWTDQPTKIGLGSVVGTPYTQWSDVGIEWRKSDYDNYSLLGLFGGRSLRLQGGGGTDVVQLRGTNHGEGSEYSVNILPASWRFGSWNSPRSLGIDANYGGLPVINLGDTGVGNGGALLRVGGLASYRMTKAQAAALAASATVAGNYFGLLIGVSDPPNGWPLWVAVSNGAGGLKWVDSRDGVTVLS